MLEVLDTTGQEGYRSLRDQWIRDKEGFLLVYSIDDKWSFTKIHKFYDEIQLVKKSRNTTAGPVPIILVRNQSDKVTERVVL